MLYETERQKLASNLSVPGPAQGEVWRDVLSSALLPPPTHKKVINLTKMKQGGESTSRYVTLRHVTSGSRQVKQNPGKYQTGHLATIRRARNQLMESLNVKYGHVLDHEIPKATKRN